MCALLRSGLEQKGQCWSNSVAMLQDLFCRVKLSIAMQGHKRGWAGEVGMGNLCYVFFFSLGLFLEQQ